MTCTGDVLEALGIEPKARQVVALGPVAAALLARLEEGALTGDEVVRASGVDSGTGAAALTELELAGCVMIEDGVYRTAIKDRPGMRRFV